MSEVLDQLREEFERLAEEAQTLTFLPRGTELQEQACARIEGFLGVLAATKVACVQSLDEVGANTVLDLELSLEVVRAELNMWLDLKRDAPEAAWDSLVSAQDLCENAIQVRRQVGGDSSGLENLSMKLLLIEQMVFPPQAFNSVGGIADRRECSVCGGDYETCDHIKGRAYMGQVCHTRLFLREVREVSIVTDPANKRCRITHFSDQGKMRNKMTWRLEDR